MVGLPFDNGWNIGCSFAPLCGTHKLLMVLTLYKQFLSVIKPEGIHSRRLIFQEDRSVLVGEFVDPEVLRFDMQDTLELITDLETEEGEGGREGGGGRREGEGGRGREGGGREGGGGRGREREKEEKGVKCKENTKYYTNRERVFVMF